MVNKAAVGILVVIVVASLGVGTLVGMQIAGTDAGETPSDTESPAEEGSDGDADDGTNDGSDDGAASDGANAGSDGTSTERHTTIPPRRFDEAAIADHVVRYVNEERADRGLERLSVGGSRAALLHDLAENQSERMADAGETDHEAGGVSVRDRYENHGIYQQCPLDIAGKSEVRYPDQTFEAHGHTYAGQPYDRDGNTTFNEDERAIARAVVDAWIADESFHEPVLMQEPTRLGVGAEVTDGGEVYVTAAVCA